RIANPASGAQTMALASTPDGQLAMAYLPDNAMIQINLDGFASTLRVTWINPSTGERTDGGTVAGSGTHTFTRPRAGDWVLLLQAV
ncbi:MAG: putative collagen-binding domain-containing protein, partial [Roseiflexaceae bacterium]|nr:putative collagen-binding domain-containing protein [Roseiflexaceae bacterium]